jgi:Zn-dependent protease with chaperone function/RNA polymerase subunit RPABC4/transcription elongation factor Spt4
MALREDLRTFPGLSHLAFQHPLDRQALDALERVPLLPQVTRKFFEFYSERFIRVSQVSSSLRITPRQFPSLFKQYERMGEVLDLQELPTLFLQTTPQINAYAMGAEDYFVVVTTGLIQLLNEDELIAVIGHELGHVKCEHMLYTTMVNFMTQFGTMILERLLPNIAQIASMSIQLALLEWYRKAEFSCDRAALLATQNPDVVCTALAKLAGWSDDRIEEFSLEEVKRQADDYEELDDTSIINKVVKLMVLLQQTHPFPVVRVKEISRWAASSEYQGILRGEYKKRDAVRAAARPVTPPARVVPTPPKTTTGTQCHACGSATSRGARFCSVCGADLQSSAQTCSQCHSLVQPDWIHCPNCGNRLASESAQEAAPPLRAKGAGHPKASPDK